MSTPLKVLVIGATGRVGAATLAALLEAGHEPIAMVRKGEQGAAFDGRAPYRVADLSREDELIEAFHGVDALLLSSGHTPQLREHQFNAIAAARAAEVPRVLKIGASPASCFEGTPSVAAAAHLAIENELASLAGEQVAIRPNSFMQNLAARAAEVARGRLRLAVGAEAVSYVDAEDIGAVAAALLTMAERPPMMVEVTGGVAMTGDDVAGVFARFLGRTVVYEPMTDAENRDRLREAGTPEWLVDHLVTMSDLIRERDGDRVSDAVDRYVGRSPYSLQDFLDRERAMFVGALTEEPAGAGS